MKKTVKVLFPILIFIFLLSTPTRSSAQIVIKKRSVIGMGGISKNVILCGKSYFLQQSIGQSGIIGTSSHKNIVVIQGFIQPEMPQNYLSRPKDLNIEIKTDPFSDIYMVSVKDSSLNKFSVDLYNLIGQKIYCRNYKNTNEFEINMNSFHAGCYILCIHTENRKFSTKLIKK